MSKLTSDSSQTPNSAGEHTGNNFDFLRFLFAVLVIFSHSFAILGTGKQEPLSLLTRHQSFLGEISVDGFFAISGFLITASWLRSRSFWSYFQKRALRIYPGFLVVCVLCAVVAAPLGAENAALYFRDLSVFSVLHHALVLDKLQLPATYAHNSIPNEVNGSLWTIKIEFECYLLVALLGSIGFFKRRVVPLILLLLGSFAWGIITLHLTDLYRVAGAVGAHLKFFVYFFAGMVFFLYRDRIAYRLPLLLIAVLLLVAATALNGLEAVMALPFVYLLMAAAFAPSTALHHFGRNRDLSYGLYLYAWPVQQMLADCVPLFHLRGTAAPYLLFCASLPITLAWAWASWYLVEKPALRLKPKARYQPIVPGSPLKGPTISEVIQPP